MASFNATIPAGVTQALFELDYSATASAVESITNAQMNSPGGAVEQLLTLLGCGS